MLNRVFIFFKIYKERIKSTFGINFVNNKIRYKNRVASYL